MKIKLLKPVVVKGHLGASVGDILEVPPNIFQTLQGVDAAVEVEGVATPKDHSIIETREPVPETRDPEPEEVHKPKKKRSN
jgi:hypothetical protein